MNLPNKLTVLRVIMVPFFVFFMLTDFAGDAGKWIALVLFCLASLTDMLDGKIARARNLVTNFGKFMDPLADKLLVCSAMTCLIPAGKLPAWVALLPVVVVNGLVVGWVLNAAYGTPLLLGMGSVALGQAVVCYVLGLPLLALLRRRLPEKLLH